MPEQQQQAAAEPSFREQVEQAESQQEPQAPAEQAAPEALQAEGEQDGEAKVKEEKVVPLAALHAERSQSKELKRQMREQQAQFQALQQQQVEMMRYVQQLAQPQAPIPDPQQDPLGFQTAGINHIAQQVNGLQQQFQQEKQAAAQQQAVNHFFNVVQAAERNYETQAPDYREAVAWAKARKQAEYESIGMSPAEASQRLQNEVFQLAQMAMQNGDDPAEVAYRMAKQIGYRRRGVSEEQRLQMQKEGQAAALPGSGSGASGGRLSLDALAKLSGNDFLEATKGDNWRKLMGKT